MTYTVGPDVATDSEEGGVELYSTKLTYTSSEVPGFGS